MPVCNLIKQLAAFRYLLHQGLSMDCFSTFFGLKFSILLFSITEQMSIHLQNKDTVVEDGYHVVAVCIKTIERL